MALDNEELLQLMLMEKIVPKDDIQDLLEKSMELNNVSITAALLEYKNKSLTEKEQERYQKQEMDALFTGVLSTRIATKSWRYKAGEDGGLQILGYKGADKRVIIPVGIGKKKVTKIGAYAFQSCKNLIDITISDNVREIGKYAFQDCENLTDITMPESLMRIDDDAFYRCISLTNITIPKNVREIGGGAFLGCTSLTSIIIPEGVLDIGLCAFMWCEALTIYASAGSYAESYAKEHKINFETIPK